MSRLHPGEAGSGSCIRAALNLGAFDYITKPLDLTYVERSLGHKLALMTL